MDSSMALRSCSRIKRNQIERPRIALPLCLEFARERLPVIITSTQSYLLCTTLVVLKLRWFCFSRGACSHLNLPSLKTLHLKDIIFDQQCQLMMLLDACPVLEDLQLSNIINLESYTRDYFDDFESSSMLRKLNRADITACNWYFYAYNYPRS
uniref:F-box/LRR-repeat protein 15/At3g58940/PEG3-like LRR domain-containing protein n=1 Tax=Medicago truncatula TaxID=3880 RepID=A2Q3T4_MEDTR|nr:hypothetical protein MtrDRAFT_AC155889g10v2 [Medicago truncatula]